MRMMMMMVESWKRIQTKKKLISLNRNVIEGATLLIYPELQILRDYGEITLRIDNEIAWDGFIKDWWMKYSSNGW